MIEDEETRALLRGLLQCNPQKRWSAEDVLIHLKVPDVTCVRSKPVDEDHSPAEEKPQPYKESAGYPFYKEDTGPGSSLGKGAFGRVVRASLVGASADDSAGRSDTTAALKWIRVDEENLLPAVAHEMQVFGAPFAIFISWILLNKHSFPRT